MEPSWARGSVIGSALGSGSLMAAMVDELRKELARRSIEAALPDEVEQDEDPADSTDGSDLQPTRLAAGTALARRVKGAEAAAARRQASATATVPPLHRGHLPGPTPSNTPRENNGAVAPPSALGGSASGGNAAPPPPPC